MTTLNNNWTNRVFGHNLLNQTFMDTLIKLLPTVVPLLIVIGGMLFGYGKLKARSVTKDECKKNQKDCNATIKRDIKELKELTIELHDKQSKRIETLREKTSDMNETLSELRGYLSTERRQAS